MRDSQPDWTAGCGESYLSGAGSAGRKSTVERQHGRRPSTPSVHRVTVPPAGVPRFHQPDARGVSAAGLTLRDRVSRPDGGMADGWETADRAPVYRLQKLPPPDTGRPAFVHLGLPQNLCPPGGARALIRDSPGQSESVDPRPVAGVAR